MKSRIVLQTPISSNDQKPPCRPSASARRFKGLRRYDAVNLLKAKSSPTSIVNSNNIVNDIALVYEDRDMVITSSGIYYSIDDFLYFCTFEGLDASVFCSYLSSDKTIATMRFHPCDSIEHRDRNKAKTAFCYAIPMDTERFTTSRGVAFVFVELEETHSLTGAICQVCSHAPQRQSGLQGYDQCAVYTDYLLKNFSDPELCASSLANEFNVSKKYLFGLFKKKTCHSPTSFLHHIRMEEAVRLLIECDDTVQEISTRVGFVNFGTFYKAFKCEYGVAPGKYCEAYRSQGKMP